MSILHEWNTLQTRRRFLGTALKGAGQLGIVVSAADLLTPYIDPMFDKLFGVEATQTSSEGGSGQVVRSQEALDYLNQRDGPQAATQMQVDPIYGERSAADTMPPPEATSREDERTANADAFADALSRTPIKVENQTNLTIELDGQALETKITQVNERQNYETLGDLKTTTER